MNTDRELMQRLEALIDAARLLGVTQAKQGFGCYTQEDARFEQAMHEAVQKHRTALRERLAQPEQEPVACAKCKEWEAVCDQHLRHIKKLKKQRTWQGLTDEEMHECWDSPLTPLGMRHARAIEAKLKEKNP